MGLICRETYLCSECNKNIRQHESYCREFAVQFLAKSSRQSNLLEWFASQSIDEEITSSIKNFEADQKRLKAIMVNFEEKKPDMSAIERQERTDLI